MPNFCRSCPLLLCLFFLCIAGKFPARAAHIIEKSINKVEPSFRNQVPEHHIENLRGAVLTQHQFKVCYGNKISFTLQISDPDPGDVIRLQHQISTQIPSALLRVSGTNPLIMDFSWSTIGELPGEYPFDFTFTDNGTPAIEQHRSYIIQVATPLWVEIEKEDIRCFGMGNGSAKVLVSGGFAPYSFSWSNGAQSSQTSRLEAGPYRVDISGEAGCNAFGAFTIYEPAPLELELVDIQHAYCNFPNGSIEIQARGGNGNYQYLWENFPDRNVPRLEKLLGEPFAEPYKVTVFDAKNCVDTLKIDLKNTPPAIADFSVPLEDGDTILLTKAILNFVNTSIGAQSYEWNLGNGTFSDKEHLTHEFEQAETHTVLLTAFNGYPDCPDTSSLTFTIVPDGNIHIPTAFSPNGDGINDQYLLKGEGIIWMQARIFNRYGKVVKTLNNLADKWDGTIAGTRAPEGVYVIHIKARLNKGYFQEQSKTLTLVR